MNRFGEKLRSLRTRRGLTVRELAAEFDMKSAGHISDMENGRSKPSVELLLRMADLFGVTTDQLLRDELDVDE